MNDEKVHLYLLAKLDSTGFKMHTRTASPRITNTLFEWSRTPEEAIAKAKARANRRLSEAKIEHERAMKLIQMHESDLQPTAKETT